MYDDSRAGALAAEAQEAGDALWDRLAYRIQPAWALPKLLWWRDEGLLRDGARLAHQPDVITARLVGHPVATDTSHALKTGYDLIGLRWPTEVLDTLHVDPDVLPPVQLAGSVLGHVGARRGGADRAAGGRARHRRHDRQLRRPARRGRAGGGRVELGARAPPSRSRASPTRCCTTRPARCTPTARRTATCGCPAGRPAPAPGVITTLFPGTGPRRAHRAARAGSATSRCATRWPSTASGSRSSQPDARGFLGDGPLPAGPDEVDDPARVFAAVCTGVAHVERLCFDLLAGAGADVSGPVSFTGGGSRNPWWNQLRCDLLGAQVRIPASAEPVASGWPCWRPGPSRATCSPRPVGWCAPASAAARPGSPRRAGRRLRRLRRRPDRPRLARLPDRRPRPEASRRMTAPRPTRSRCSSPATSSC